MKRNIKLYVIALLCAILPDWFVFLIVSQALHAGQYEKAGQILWTAFYIVSAISAILVAAIVIRYILLKKGYYVSIEKARLVLKEKESQLTELNRKYQTQSDIVHALSDDFDCIFLVDLITGRFETVLASGIFESFGLERSGEDFFAFASETMEKHLFSGDRDYVLSSCCPENMAVALQERGCCTLSFRLLEEDAPVYYQAKLVKAFQSADTAILGIRSIDGQMRREILQRELEDALRNSRIKNSISQMQPHFLYNALGSIREIVLFDPEYASELICDFTTHLRACVRTLSNDEPVPFSQELENIRAYVRIEQMRFGDKLRVDYDIEADEFDILPLSVQPLVENAIRHGIYERGPVGGTVTLRTREQDDAWYIQVLDDGVGFDKEQTTARIRCGEQDSTGLENLTFRLEKMMNARISIESKTGVGTCVEIYIPKGA